MQSRLSGMSFEDSDPVKGFDRSKVSGLIAELIDLKDPRTTTALEVTAGGKLYNVVVDTEVTGKQLLAKGQLKRRVTIIPLNQIAARSISPKAVAAAKNLVGERNVHVALSLVGYPEEVETAMQYVFGSTLVCKTMDIAKKVTFDKDVRCKSVTLDGDVFDPAGTLTGGSRAKGNSVLLRLQELKVAREELAALEARAAEISAELNQLQANAAAYAKTKALLDLKTHEAELVRARVEQSTHHAVVAEVRELERLVAEQDADVKAAQAAEKEAKARCARIEKEMKEQSTQRDAKLKEVQKAIASAKKTATKCREAMAKAKARADEIRLESEAIAGEIEGMQAQLASTKESVTTLLAEEEELADEVREKKAAFKEAEARWVSLGPGFSLGSFVSLLCGRWQGWSLTRRDGWRWALV